MTKKSISVMDMGRLLGIKKTESYWLIKKRYFDVITISGHMRVMLESFEKWYSEQLHYKKVTGEAPGSAVEEITMSVKEAAAALGICETTVYDVLKRSPIKTAKIDNRTRIFRDSFIDWFNQQDRYPIIKSEEDNDDI